MEHERHTLADRAYAEVKSLIQGDGFSMGEKLTEERVCELLGLSRTPVRSALVRLEAEGLLVRNAGRGYHLPVYTLEDVREIYGCRALLESEAVRLTAMKGLTTALYRQLREVVRQMDELFVESPNLEKPSLRAKFLALNHQFHALIYDNCGNDYLRRLISTASDLPRVLRNFMNFSGEQLAESHAAHQHVLAALKRGEGERAAALMREHIWSARDRMVMEPPKRRGRPPKHPRSPRGKLILTPPGARKQQTPTK